MHQSIREKARNAAKRRETNTIYSDTIILEYLETRRLEYSHIEEKKFSSSGVLCTSDFVPSWPRFALKASEVNVISRGGE